MKISIITATFNSAATITDTMRSIAEQDHDNIEHLIVDGGSADNTVALVQAFPHVTKLVSEKDNGIYDAMNKGIKLATGDIIGILNSDDIYTHDQVLSKVSTAFADESVDAVYGDLQYVDAQNTGRVIRTWKAGKYRPRLFYYGWMPPHPTFFVRRKVYAQAGVFNLSLRSSADYELMLRILLRHNMKPAYLPEILVKMRTGGQSNATLKNRLRANREDRMAWELNGLKPYFFTMYLKPIRKLSQFIIK
jgi:glycosyltransferase involved in cell wall biosynthesis